MRELPPDPGLDGKDRPAILPRALDVVVDGGPPARPISPGRPTRPDRPGRPRAALLLFLALFAVSLYETTTSLLASHRAPTDGDWASAAAEVRAGFKPGDLIVFAPGWTDPVGRLWLGDLIPPEMAARPDADRYGRIWQLSIRGARAPETLPDDILPTSENRHGKVRVTLYTRSHPAAVPLADFTASLGEARVVQTPGGAAWANACTRAGDDPHLPRPMFRCNTTTVERRILEVDYAPHRGVLVPADGKLFTRVEYPNVPLGTRIVGEAGLHDYYARKNSDAPVLFKVYIGERAIFERRVKNEDGWLRFEAETGAATGSRGTVVFEVSAPVSAAWRNFGFHAESRGEGGAP